MRFILHLFIFSLCVQGSVFAIATEDTTPIIVSIDPISGFPDKEFPIDQPFVLRVPLPSKEVNHVYVRRTYYSRHVPYLVKSDTCLSEDRLSYSRFVKVPASQRNIIAMKDEEKTAGSQFWLYIIFDGSEEDFKKGGKYGGSLSHWVVSSNEMLDVLVAKESISIDIPSVADLISKCSLETAPANPPELADFDANYEVGSIGSNVDCELVEEQVFPLLDQVATSLESLRSLEEDLAADLSLIPDSQNEFCWIWSREFCTCDLLEGGDNQIIQQTNLAENVLYGTNLEDGVLKDLWASSNLMLGVLDTSKSIDVNGLEVSDYRMRLANCEADILLLRDLRVRLNAVRMSHRDSLCSTATCCDLTKVDEEVLIRIERLLYQKKSLFEQIIEHQENLVVLYQKIGGKKTVTYTHGISQNTFLKTHERRQQSRIIPEVGLLGHFDDKSLQGVLPYVGFEIGFKPVNDDVPFRSKIYPGLKPLSRHRYFVFLGYSLNNIYGQDSNKLNLLEGGALTYGLGYRLSHTLKINAGVVNYFETNSFELISERKVRADFAIGLSADLRIAEWVTSFKSAFGK